MGLCRAVTAIVWATVAGVLINFQVVGISVLDRSSGNDVSCLLYVGTGCFLVSFLWLAILSFIASGEQPRRPQKRWYLYGGLLQLSIFGTIPAGIAIGFQLVLLLLFIGAVCAAIWLDAIARHSVRRPMHMFVGFVLLFVSGGLEVVGSLRFVEEGSTAVVVLACIAMLACGALVTVQAQMSQRLADDLGSTPRSAAAGNLFTSAIALPLCVLWHYLADAPYDIDTSRVWLWLLLGFATAFCTQTFVDLPKIFGYSTVFGLAWAGNLASSLALGHLGLLEHARHWSIWRCVSAGVAAVGAVLCSTKPAALVVPTEAEGHCRPMIDTMLSSDSESPVSIFHGL